MASRQHALGISLVCAGILAVQLLWLLTVPPYGGMDEFDHAYRASSVADGHWASKHREATHGRGNLILVPEKIVTAAHPTCDSLLYPGHDNCNPVSDPNASGEVLVASAAATYNPVFYFVIGTVAKPIQGGIAALYAMRVAALVLCDALIAIALLIVGWTARTLWPVSAVILVGTPMVLYSTAIAAPNGLQACAAVLMWCALLPAVTRQWNEQTHRLLWVGSASSAVVMLTHSTGPLWVFLTMVVLILLAGRSWLVDALTHHRRSLLSPVGVVGAVAALASAWIVWQGTNSPSGDAGDFGPLPLSATIQQPILWILQSVASIPFRNQAAPVSVYAVALSLFVTMLVLGWRAGSRRMKVTTALIATLSVVVPLALSISTYRDLGFAWQGRYALPFAFGIAIATASALDDSPRYQQLSRVAAPAVAVGSLFIEARELVHVVALEHPMWGAEANAFVICCCLVSAVMICGGLALLSRTTVVVQRRATRVHSVA